MSLLAAFWATLAVGARPGYAVAPRTLTESSRWVFNSLNGVAINTLQQESDALGNWAIAEYQAFAGGKAAYGTNDNLSYLFRFYGTSFALSGYRGPDGAAFTVKVNGQVVGTGSNYSATVQLGTWFSWAGPSLDNYEVEITKGLGTALYCDSITLR